MSNHNQQLIDEKNVVVRLNHQLAVALVPFAKMAAKYDPEVPDGETIFWRNGAVLTLGDLRDAAKALADADPNNVLESR